MILNARWVGGKQNPRLEFLKYDVEKRKKEIEAYKFPFKPYFFVKTKDYLKQKNKIEKILSNIAIGSEIEKVNAEYRGEKVVKIKVPTPIDRRKAKKELSVETYESDVPYVRRVMIDKGIQIGIPKTFLAYDIEVDAREKVPEPDKANKRVISIAAVDNEGNRFFFCEDDEKALINSFLELTEHYPVCVGWYSGIFDYPYLKNRARKLGILYDFFRFINLDGALWYKDSLQKQDPDSFGLDDVGKYEGVGEKTEDLETLGEMSKLWTFFKENRERLKKYNMEDARITMEIVKKFDSVKTAFSMASKSFIRLEDLVKHERGGGSRIRESVAVDALILHTGQQESPRRVQKRRVFKRDEDVEDYKGGRVQAKKGTYDGPVALLDFSSMYPSIIRAFNIGPQTWRSDKEGTYNAPHGSFDASPDSIIKLALKEIAEEREKMKKERDRQPPGSDAYKTKKTAEKALKKLLLSFYGVLGYPSQRYYKKEIVENVTLIGQELIKCVERKAKKEGHLPVRTDTDGSYIKINTDSDKDYVEIARDLKEKIEPKARQFMKKKFNVSPKHFVLEIDVIFSRLSVIHDKGLAGLVIYENDQRCFYKKTKGLMSIKSSSPDALKEFQNKLVDLKLQGRSMAEQVEYVEDFKTEMLEGEHDKELVQRKGLGMPIEEYDSLQSHARAAKMLKEEGVTVRVGDKIPYIKTGNDKKDVKPVIKSELPELGWKERLFNFNNYFKPLAERMGVKKYKQKPLTRWTGEAKKENLEGENY